MAIRDAVNPGVVNRPLELRAVAKFLQSAEEQPHGLILEGEAGIGKTTVWLAVVEQARERGFCVLTARVGQTESVLAYAALADILRNVTPDVLAALPEPQGIAVDRVLLRAQAATALPPMNASSRRHSPAVVERLAAEAPVLIAIDDVQWLDRPAGPSWHSPPGGCGAGRGARHRAV